MPLVFVSSPRPDVVTSVLARVEQAFVDLGFKTPISRESHETLGVLVFPRSCQEGIPASVTRLGVLHTYGFAVCDSAPDAVADALAGAPSAWETTFRTLDGPFLLSLASGSRVRLATDRMGACHAFSVQIDGATVVSTAALPLARAARAPLDPESAREFLASGSVFGNQTLFQGVSKLAAGTVFNLEMGTLSTVGTWFRLADILFDHQTTGTSERWADEMVQAMRRIGSRVERPVLDLTGGFDSRGVLAAALKSGMTVTTVTNGEPTSGDIVAAARIASEFGLKHHAAYAAGEVETYSSERLAEALRLSDGEIDVFLGSPVAITQERNAGLGDASIQGSCGEFARAYWWDLVRAGTHARGAIDARWVATKRFASETWAENLLLKKRGSLVDHFADLVDQSIADIRDLPQVAQADAIYIRMRMQRWGGRYLSATLRQTHSIVPFAFLGPMREALSAPPGVRRGDRMPRQLIAYLNPRLASLPLDSGAPASPIGFRNLWRFTPLLGVYGGKVMNRVRRWVGKAAPPPLPPAALVAALRRDDLRGALRLDAMASASLYDPTSFTPWISTAFDPDRPRVRGIARILTLEMAARASQGR